MKKWIVCLCSAACLTTLAVLGPTPGAADEIGLCTALGCGGGETKCADGSFDRNGYHVEFTCYTTIHPE